MSPDRQDRIDQRLERLSQRPFRARFKLRDKELELLNKNGIAGVREHAIVLLGKRLFPAKPYKDGKQTPYRGHPVFVAQHATATCCRTCLERWHLIPKFKELDAQEQSYVLDVIETWLSRSGWPKK